MFFKDQTCLHCAGPPAPGRPVKFKLIAIHRDINSDSSLRWPRGRRPCQHDKANALEAAGTARLTRQPGPEGLIQVPGRPQARPGQCSHGGRSACDPLLG